MTSIFSKIAKHEVDSYSVCEDNEFMAFLDINPIKKGHTLVILKKQIDYFFDLDDDVMSRMIVFAKKVAKGIKKTIQCNRVGAAIIGLEIPHVHIHLVPIDCVNDINFKNSVKISSDEMKSLANKIRENIETT